MSDTSSDTPFHVYVDGHWVQAKRTRYDKYLADMTIEKMAELLTTYENQQNYLEDTPYFLWVNDAGKYSYCSEAIAAEIAWLNSEVDE